MSKINRFNGNLQPFALNASTGARYVFGNDAVTGNDLDSNITADFIKGWENGTVTDAGGNDYPPMSFFNALGYTSTALSAYLHQVGVPDYNALQEYYKGSLTNVDGVLYASKTGEDGTPNVGNNPATDRDNWKTINVPDIDTIADLRALTSTYDTIWVSGYHTKDDGAFGSNIFRWNPTSTEDDNGGTIIKLDSVATGRYELQYSGAVNVKWFGAKGDGVTDDTEAIQSAIDLAGNSIDGLTVFFDYGTFVVSDSITITQRNINILGTGKRNIQSPSYVTNYLDNTVPSTILANTTNSLFILSHTEDINGFTCRDITFLGLNVDNINRSSACFDFNLDGIGNFKRDFLFDSVSILKFTHAFLMQGTGSGSDSSFGKLNIQNSNIMHNRWIHRNINGQWNSFKFIKNEGGQNGYQIGEGGISVSAQSLNISDNILEGQRNAIQVNGLYNGGIIAGNYFEGNVGEACIYNNQTAGLNIYGNNYASLNCPSIHNNYSVNTKIDDGSDFSAQYHYCSLPKTDTISLHPMGASYHGGVIKKIADTKYADMSDNLVYSNRHHTAKGIMKNSNALYTSSYTSSSNGLMSHTAYISASIGDVIMVVTAVDYVDSPTLPVTINIRPNSGTGDDAYFGTFYNSNRIGDNSSMVIIQYVKLSEAISNLELYIYLFGLNPPAGLVANFRYPEVYNLGNISHENIPITIDIDNHLSVSGGVPTSGAWKKGKRIYTSEPVAGGNVGWVCTSSGTPGTWKTFGAISA